MGTRTAKRKTYAKPVQLVDQEESDYNGDEDSMVINVNEESEKETGKPYTSKDSPMDGNSR